LYYENFVIARGNVFAVIARSFSDAAISLSMLSLRAKSGNLCLDLFVILSNAKNLILSDFVHHRYVFHTPNSNNVFRIR